MINRLVERLCGALAVLLLLVTLASNAIAVEKNAKSGEYRGTLRVVKFDVSPALRNIPPLPAPQDPSDWGSSTIDPSGTKGSPPVGPQSTDTAVQSSPPVFDIPAPSTSFDIFSNPAIVTPPDPVGDIGPNHYVTMSNFHFAIHSRAGGQLAAPMPNNTLWSNFGGVCQTRNSGDPIVLYDQFADRWLLTQFSGNHAGEKFNCVALSTGPDPLGTYFRWQISNGPDQNFPDYPKYGIGEEAYFLATRDFGPNNGPYLGVGVFALNRAEMIAGNPNPSVIFFFVDRTDQELVGDGLLPMDIDGPNLPPPGAPHYFLGSMDDGGPYGAPQDALNVWEFSVDFVTPANSSFTLTHQLPIAPMDTIIPCTIGRRCIPQPGTQVMLDHQGYRQRPLHRLAYQNFGTHESLVTNQSVEAVANISGIRWWEIRVVDDQAPVVYQEGTFAPGVSDGIHRWFGSAAQDGAGNIALGYSAANAVTFPSIWYSGRLASDPVGTMPQGEGVIVNGSGSQLDAGSRWGDYTSMNLDPTDDCTFWYLNEYYQATHSTEWTLRVGAFTFDECDDPAFSLINASPAEAVASADVCAGDDAKFNFNLGSINGFNSPVTMSVSGNPAPTSATFDLNPVTPLPGSTILTIGNTATVSAGVYSMEVTAMAAGAGNRTSDLELQWFENAPLAPSLIMPTDDAVDVSLAPTFEWSEIANSQEYTIEVATDAGFSNVVFSETVDDTTTMPFNLLTPSTQYFWRVSASNICGPSGDSGTFTFTTEALPGVCSSGQVETIVHEFDFEDGAQGWTSGTNLGPNTWALSGANPNDGAQHWHVDDVGESSDTFLTSPALAIPSDIDTLTLRFFNYQDFENVPGGDCWDGGMLEVSTDGGSNFVEVVNGDLLTDPYDGPLQHFSNPLQGREAWCGVAQPYLESRVDIHALAGEADVRFRFRIATDISGGADGWDIDDVQIVGCAAAPLEFDDGFEHEDD